MQVVEVQQVAVRAPNVPAVAAVQADTPYLYGVGRDPDGVEHRHRIQCVEAVSDV